MDSRVQRFRRWNIVWPQDEDGAQRRRPHQGEWAGGPHRVIDPRYPEWLGFSTVVFK